MRTTGRSVLPRRYSPTPFVLDHSASKVAVSIGHFGNERSCDTTGQHCSYPPFKGITEERQRRSRGITRSQRVFLNALGRLGKVGVGFALSPSLEDSLVPLERGTDYGCEPVE